ncbi:hypothetical protein PILCRDRAFT_12564 [Piloderma croceum F 1598]|uniref:Uncharacterized protein n=1 Tax=Piloderma croceum (strain F 1598) TaxID=765440 RepID=A0A0C3EVZ5_PILCF|nr:hypothetical protein PILCRDRAFT_12564 [Piloderma croceum F 1598]
MAHRTYTRPVSMVAYETYANALITKGHGHPLWEPDPGEYAPVDLGDVGYLRKGAFVKLFNASKDIYDYSNRSGLPRGHRPLFIRDILRQTPLAKAPEYISSEGVQKKGAELAVTAGTFWQAGGGFSFECSHQQGALLIMGGDAYREDASNQLDFSEYIIKHHRSWLDFAHSLGCDLSLSDLILVDGCDKTSEWACAAWSGKSSSSLRLNFVAGAPGIADGTACLWGQWDSSESLDKNVGPRPLIPPVTGQDTTLPLTSQSSEAMSIDDPPLHPHAPLSPSVPHLFNQCVFVRGFQISDRTTFFKRKRTRIDVGNGFKTAYKPLDSKKWKRNNSTAMDSSQHLQSSEGSQSSPSGMSRTNPEIIQSQRTSQPGGYHESDEEAEVNVDEHNTIAEVLMGYIFEKSTAKLALIHDGDIIDLLQDSSDVRIHNYNSWIRQLVPPVYVDEDVGMFLGTYNLTTSPSGKSTRNSSLGHHAVYVQTEGKILILL